MINELLSSDPPAAVQTAPLLSVKDLSFNYPDGHPALRGVSFQVQPGEKIALVGPNGAGKSTLLLHLNGILTGKGAVRVAGLELNSRTVRQVRARVGLVFQNPDDQLFSPTVFDDVAYGPIYQGLPEAEVRRRAAEALAAVGMEEYAGRISHHLSVGEKKRIAIATVLSMQPDLLAFDEPTAGLDPRARRGLIRLLQRLPQTALVVTHDLRMAREVTPRVLLMDGGLIVADCPTEDLLRDTALLADHGLEFD